VSLLSLAAEAGNAKRLRRAMEKRVQLRGDAIFFDAPLQKNVLVQDCCCAWWTLPA
jgi:hypothetical protein